MQLSKEFVETYLRIHDNDPILFRGIPIKGMTNDELMACVTWSFKYSESKREESNRRMDFVSDLMKMSIRK